MENNLVSKKYFYNNTVYDVLNHKIISLHLYSTKADCPAYYNIQFGVELYV